ncbi:glycosyltransferase [Abyssisolibacter fermentans]|uniref:glycosyltransferase n=1 Tax=Abyssisolibacter fermentans TaxID=1766203 RepID=UPI00138F286A|nr:glycosyltransferase [Abyssisolibacter fermentans]
MLLRKKIYAPSSKKPTDKKYDDFGVSIITITNKFSFLTNIFNNYSRQLYKPKELIILLNHDYLDLPTWNKKATEYKNVKVFKLPSHYTLGRCINYAIYKAKYPLIAKFDDDDYYSDEYLNNSIKVMGKTNADVVGKGSHLVYFKTLNTLALRNPGYENKFVNFVNGSTLLFKKSISDSVKFRNMNAAEDVFFCRDCLSMGFKVYSTNRYDHIYIRYPNKLDHTWKITDKTLLNKHCITLEKNISLEELKKKKAII